MRITLTQAQQESVELDTKKSNLLGKIFIVIEGLRQRLSTRMSKDGLQSQLVGAYVHYAV